MNKPARWYIGSRGEALALLFLNDLGAVTIRAESADMGFDLVAVFSRREMMRVVMVEVRATERELASGVGYPVPARQSKAFRNSNVPLLLLVIDVKRNREFFAWIGRSAESRPRESRSGVTFVRIRDADDQGREDLLRDVFGIAGNT
jgi:hypothetical protein